MIQDVKTSLRITNSYFDNEILDLIEAAKADLILSGVNRDKVIDTDFLIKRAVTLYCKGHFGYDNPDAEKFLESYEMLKIHLTLSGDYNAP